jgi:hypothetical protein
MTPANLLKFPWHIYILSIVDKQSIHLSYFRLCIVRTGRKLQAPIVFKTGCVHTTIHSDWTILAGMTGFKYFSHQIFELPTRLLGTYER